MSTVAASDANCALGAHLPPPALKAYPAGTFKVEKVGSLDDFKAKFIGLRSLRPAVLVGHTLWLHDNRQQQ